MITVIIPTYNRGTTLGRAISSVLNQTYKNIELIIIDDNSTDNTEQIVKAIQDYRIKYIKLNDNYGACYARNIGIENAKGDYIAFQDSDDEWLPEKLDKQLKYLKDKELDLISCRMYQIFNENKINIFPPNINLSDNSIYRNNKISTQTILGRKECFLKDQFDVNIPRFQDWDLVLRLIKKFKCEITSDILVKAYIQEDSISKNPDKAIKALEIFLDKHGKTRRIKGYLYRQIGLYKMQKNEDYRRYLIKAFSRNPSDKIILVDFIFAIILPRKIHYEFYKRKGRFA